MGAIAEEGEVISGQKWKQIAKKCSSIEKAFAKGLGHRQETTFSQIS